MKENLEGLSLNIAIDVIAEENIRLNIHKIVKGVSTETLLMTMDDFKGCDGSFPEMWKIIGNKIHEHMKDNPAYDDLGS